LHRLPVGLPHESVLLLLSELPHTLSPPILCSLTLLQERRNASCYNALQATAAGKLLQLPAFNNMRLL
jgi:hypothetical protein